MATMTMATTLNKTSFSGNTANLRARTQSRFVVAKPIVVRAQKDKELGPRRFAEIGLIAGAAALALAITPAPQADAAYPKVNIVNSTNFIASGKVEYPGCKDVTYQVTPNTTWTAKSRGVCLVTKITASVKTPSGDFQAQDYTSSGTSYSKFAVINGDGVNKFLVTRRTG